MIIWLQYGEFDILSISKNSFAPIYTQSVVTYAALLANDTIDLDYPGLVSPNKWTNANPAFWLATLL